MVTEMHNGQNEKTTYYVLLSRIYTSAMPLLHLRLKENYKREFKTIVRTKTRMCAGR